MYDMVLVSKCSMVQGGLAVVEDGLGVDLAHARDADQERAAATREGGRKGGRERAREQWQTGGRA